MSVIQEKNFDLDIMEGMLGISGLYLLEIPRVEKIEENKIKQVGR